MLFTSIALILFSLVSGGKLTLMGGGFQDHSTSTEYLFPAVDSVWRSSHNLTEETWTACSVMVSFQLVRDWCEASGAQVSVDSALVLGGSASSASQARLYNITTGQSRLLEDMITPRLGQHGCSLVRSVLATKTLRCILL